MEGIGLSEVGTHMVRAEVNSVAVEWGVKGDLEKLSYCVPPLT